MRSRRFLQGLSWLLVLNILIKPVWIFLIDRNVQLQSGNEAYGNYFAVLNLTLVLAFLADAGLSTMANQMLAGAEDLSPAPMIRVKIVLLGIYVLVCLFVAWLTHFPHRELLYHVIIIQVLTSALVFTRNLLTAAQKFATDAWISILDKGLVVIICAPLLYSFTRLDIITFLRIQILTSLIAVIICAVPVYRHYRSKSGSTSIPSLLRRMIPFAITIAVMGAHNRLDGFLIERLHPQGSLQAGIYAMAYRLVDAGNMMGYLAASFLVPYLAFQRDQLHRQSDLIVLLRNILLFISAGLAGFLLASPDGVQQLLYHTNDSFVNKVLWMSVAVLPAYMIIHIYGSVLTAVGRLRRLGYLVFMGLVLNVILNCWLIPTKGAEGAAMAALLSQYLTAFLLWFTVPGEEKISKGMADTLRVVGSTLLLLLGIWAAGSFLKNVWSILATAVILTLVLVFTQFKAAKRLVSSS